MKNNKGVTLIAVVVMIIVIIIIATVSIMAAPKLLTNSKAYVSAQEFEAVRAAISSRKTQVDMQGTITPKGEQLVGTLSPTIAGGQIVATNWYLLNDAALRDLGVKETSAHRFLVNYDRLVVISMDDDECVDQYLNYMFIDKVLRESVTEDDYVGDKLTNNTAVQTGKMVIDPKNTNGIEVFGDGWYLVMNTDFIAKLTGDYDEDLLKSVYQAGDNYLVNYEDYKFYKMTGTMQIKQ